MFIEEVRIKGFRNFENFKMKLKPFTLIIGENNIGKSNLLNAIGLIFGQDISIHRKRILLFEDFNTKMIKKFNTKVFNTLNEKKYELESFDYIEKPEVSIELYLTNLNEDQEAVVAEWYIDKELDTAKVTYQFTPNKELFSNESKWFNELIKNHKADKIKNAEDILIPLSYYRYKIFGGLNNNKQIDYYFLNMFKMEFLDALRDAKKELVSQNDYRLLNRILRNKAENGEAFIDLFDKLDSLNTSIEQNKDITELKRNLSRMLKDISMENSKEPISLKFDTFSSTELFKRLSLFYGDNQINIENNGLGKNNLLYIALVLSYLEQLEESNRNIFYRLIAIEEPEAHLHPHLQKHLSSRLDKQICEFFQTKSCKKGKGCNQKCKDKQIIVTSHSTHISSHLPLEYLAVLFNDKNKVDSHYILGGFGNNAIDKRHIRYLKKYLTATNSTMFFAQKIVLVEGISEQILFPEFYKIETGNTPEKDGVSIINVNSVAFKHFLEIINNGYFKKCLVITDSDEGTKTEERANTLKEEYETKNSRLFRIEKTSEETFEIDLIKTNQNETKLFLFDTLNETCPNLLKSYKKIFNSTVNVDEMFKLIYCKEPDRNYKSEFAFNLSERLTSDFNIPNYIKKGIKFLGKIDE